MTAGIVSTGPVVVCENVAPVPAVYVQSQATIGAGAVDVVPLNVQLSVLPPLVIVQVSVSVVPVMPKLAVATFGGWTEIEADADTPPYEPVIGAGHRAAHHSREGGECRTRRPGRHRHAGRDGESDRRRKGRQPRRRWAPVPLAWRIRGSHLHRSRWWWSA